MHENREASETPAEAGRWVKATSRKTHAHVFEESDGGVVPVKHPNKAGQLAAEGVEGRSPTKENTHNPTHHRHRAGNVCHKVWWACAEQHEQGREGSSLLYFTM
jgi:hypothetical protein